MSLQPLLASDEDGRTSGISVITERCTTEDVFVLWGAISWIENLFKESIGPKNKKNDEKKKKKKKGNVVVARLKFITFY